MRGRPLHRVPDGSVDPLGSGSVNLQAPVARRVGKDHALLVGSPEVSGYKWDDTSGYWSSPKGCLQKQEEEAGMVKGGWSQLGNSQEEGRRERGTSARAESRGQKGQQRSRLWGKQGRIAGAGL
ncbi:UNVERIFIED_CONTAM: hypothetical protein K2H54_051705 [Gekko kuhli]